MSSLLRKMNIISRCAGVYRSRELPEEELAPFLHSFVFAVCKHPGFSQDQLARHLCLNKSTVTRRLTNLEQNGYVTRRPAETDKRVTLVYPTEKMLAIFPRVREITRDWNETVSEGISEEELAVFHEVLDKISVKAKALAGIASDGEAETT